MVERVVGLVDDEFERVYDFEVASVQGSEQRTDDNRGGGGGIASVFGLDRSARIVLADAENRQRMPASVRRSVVSESPSFAAGRGLWVITYNATFRPCVLVMASGTLSDEEKAAEPKVEAEIAKCCISHYVSLQILPTDHAGSILHKELSQLIPVFLHRMLIEDQG